MVVGGRGCPREGAVRSGGDSPADCHAISAALLLADSPCGCGTLRFQVCLDQLGPFDSALDAQHSGFCVEVEGAVHSAHIQENGACRELLPTCGVAAPRKGNYLSALPRSFD